MAHTITHEKKWLLKSSTHEILGPFQFQDVKYALLKKEIFPNDEACLPSEHWEKIKNIEEFLMTVKEISPHSIEDKTQAISQRKPILLSGQTSAREVTEKEVPSGIYFFNFLRRHHEKFLLSAALIVLVLVSARYIPSLIQPKTPTHYPDQNIISEIKRAQELERIGQFERAFDIHQGLVKKYPSREDVRLAWARFYYVKGDFALSQAELSPLLSADPQVSKWAYLYLGLIDMKLEEYDDALIKLQKAKDLDEKFLPALYNLGTAYFQKRELAQAKLYFETYFLNSQDFEPHFLLGQTYALLSNFSSAISEFEEAVKMNPRFWGSYFMMAQSYFQLGQKRKALEVFEDMFSLDPQYEQVFYRRPEYYYINFPFHSRIHVYSDIVFQTKPPYVKGVSRIGLLQFLAGDETAGFQRVDEVLKNTKTDALTYALLGVMQQKKENLSEAHVAFREALQFSKSLFLANLYLGRIALKKKDADTAESYFQKILESNNKSIEALTGLGEVYSLRGDTKTARYYWERALEFDPAYNPAFLNLKKLEN
ncbi:MAG TPA: tetratricopeptide repeat protein [Bdellovibrionota bacterium]|nr:tetratricopeptide repeat protein [Bdellovibrionota bacterium]